MKQNYFSTTHTWTPLALMSNTYGFKRGINSVQLKDIKSYKLSKLKYSDFLTKKDLLLLWLITLEPCDRYTSFEIPNVGYTNALGIKCMAPNLHFTFPQTRLKEL